MSKNTTITVRGAVALGVGSMVGAGIFALMGEAARMAGSAVWAAFLGAGFGQVGYTVLLISAVISTTTCINGGLFGMTSVLLLSSRVTFP